MVALQGKRVVSMLNAHPDIVEAVMKMQFNLGILSVELIL